jgi:uncharacterized protein YkwD
MKESVPIALRKSINQLRLVHGSSPHALRATFIATVRENGAKLEDVQEAVGHADRSTTQLYDRGRWWSHSDLLARSERRMVGTGVQIIDTDDSQVRLPRSVMGRVEVMVHRWVLLVGLALAWGLMPAVISAQAAETRTSGDQSPDLTDVVERLISRTHAFRQQKGLPPVVPNPQLTATARDFATFMARTGKLSHTADGQTPEARARAHGYDACLIAENIAYQQNPAGFTTEALTEGFFQGWQHSPNHRKNLLDPAVTETGVGVAQSEQTGAYYAVQLFGRPMSQRIEFQITNTSDLTIPYTIDGQTFSLPPQSTHTHQQCRPAEVTFRWPGTQERTTVRPNHGERYTIVQGDAGAFRVEPR